MEAVGQAYRPGWTRPMRRRTTMSTQAEPRFVLAALDGSAADQLVVQWALGEAAHRGLPLRLVHVAAPGAAGSGPDPQEVIAAGRGIAAAGSADVRIEDRAP